MAALLTDTDADTEQDNHFDNHRPESDKNNVAEEALAFQSIEELAKIFKLLADETRLRILFVLQRSPELNVLELCKELDQRQPSVSHHLALLRVAGLIAMRREGKHNFYRVLPRRFEEIVATVFRGDAENPLRAAFESQNGQHATDQCGNN